MCVCVCIHLNSRFANLSFNVVNISFYQFLWQGCSCVIIGLDPTSSYGRSEDRHQPKRLLDRFESGFSYVKSVSNRIQKVTTTTIGKSFSKTLYFLMISLEIKRSWSDMGGDRDIFSWRFGLVGLYRVSQGNLPLNPLLTSFGGGHSPPATTSVNSSGCQLRLEQVGQVAGFGGQPSPQGTPSGWLNKPKERVINK